MPRKPLSFAVLAVFLIPNFCRAQLRPVQQKTPAGVLEGVVSPDGKVRSFKGIPYAAPPVGSLRWKPPQPLAPWPGVRKAVNFGPRCMQARVYDDMIFRDEGPSEDCLYLNVWLPENHGTSLLPVMVWIYGGGFKAGATSEPRQDGSNLSKKGVLVVSMNYRLGIFGFFSHPELDKESGYNSSGNYGLMDQLAALKWVHENIALFGGDPDNVTIFGESAGSASVSAQVASPLAHGLFRRAIGESGAVLASKEKRSRNETERIDLQFAKSVLRANSLSQLRDIPAAQLLEAAAKDDAPKFSWNIDGYFLPQSPDAIYAAGKQNHVALLAGWNLDEGSAQDFFDKQDPTPENFAAKVRSLYGSNAGKILKLYPSANVAETKRSAADLDGDRFISFETWKWLELHRKTGQSPVYRYRFEETLPIAANSTDQEPSAPHASEIEFVFQVLPSRDLPWRPQDEKTSELMATYWTNFAKTGDPNGEGLPHWPAYAPQKYEVMHLTAQPEARPDDHRDRYLFLEKVR